MNGTCSAHEILYDTVTHLRDNQTDMYNLIRDMADKQGKQDTEISLINAKVDTGFQEIQATQKQIIVMIGKRKWTVNKFIALASALFGSGSIGYALIMVMVRG